MSEEKGNQQPPMSAARDIENGVFNMIISLVKRLEQEYPAEDSRNYVAMYLESLAEGLRDLNEKEEEDQDDH